MIIRGATLFSRLAVTFAVLFSLIACGGGGGGSSFYDPDNGNSGGGGTSDPLTITTTALPNAIDGVQYTAVVQAAGGNDSYSWAVLNGGGTGLTIDNGGILSGIAPASGSYGLTIQVKDSGGQSATTSLILTVTGTGAPAPLAIATTALPNAAAGKDYNAVLVATGGQGDYQWTMLNDGDSGLQLNPDGLLSGTGPASGQYAITVSVQDDTRTVSSTLILTSGGAGAAPLTITTTSLPTGIVNERYAAVLNATGGNVPYVWTLASNGGSGLTLSTAGVLSGVPDLPGTYGLVFRVGDGTSTAQTSLTLTIKNVAECEIVNGVPVCPTALTITTTSLPIADRVLYAASVQAVGGKLPYTWSGGDTSSPGTGFKVDAASGSITGNANNLLPGLYGFTVTVSDSASATDTRSYVIEVPGGDLPPVRILTENPLPTATENLTYSVVMRAVGGGADKTWEVLETIKDGASILISDGPNFDAPGGNADSGVLFWSAANVTAGDYLVTIKVTGVSPDDPDTSSDVVTFNLQAVDPVIITTANPLPNATTGVNYNTTITSTGGGPTNTWTVLSTVPEAGGAAIANGPTFASPPGNASTGVLGWASANVVAGRYRVTVKVTNINDGVTTTAQRTFDLQAN
jgi:hypothetical protein